jgi:hypothetical protein
MDPMGGARFGWLRAGRALAIAWLAAGCATTPAYYLLPEQRYLDEQVEPRAGAPQLERGRSLPPLDRLNDWIISLPTKLLLWNRHLLDHRLEPDAERVLRHYLELNGLRSVKVRHNAYAPVDEFRRLVHNREVGAPYRYTLGILTWLRYTLLPDRLLAGLPLIGAGDHFNPFSNTIHVYSSDLAVLAHEAGHAKDYLWRDSRGTTFALVRLIPLVDLLQEERASSDAIRFFRCIARPEDELHAYRALIPAYATYIGGYFPGGPILFFPIVVVGHVAGRLQARHRREELARSDPVAELRAPWCTPLGASP